METHVPEAVQKDLHTARIGRLKKASRLRIETPDGHFRILRLGDTGFPVTAEDASHLRGLVDVYDGPTQLFQCLIVAACEDAGVMTYEFKRMTPVASSAARDFAAEDAVPAGLIEDLGPTT